MTHSGQITIPPSLSTPRPKGLRCSNIKWWAIYKNLPVDVIVRLPHPRSSNSQGQESFLAPSLYKQIRNYDTQFSNHHPSLSTVRSNRLSHSKMKWWAIYKNLPVDVIVRLLHPRRRGSQGLETFLTLSTDKETRNNDTECSNHHPFLSTTRPNGLSRSKRKWWAIYIQIQYYIHIYIYKYINTILYIYIYNVIYNTCNILLYILKTKYEIFLQWNTKVFLSCSVLLDLAKTVWVLQILSQKFTRNFVIKRFWALVNYVLVNMLLCSSHFTEYETLSIHWYMLKTFSLPSCPSYLDAYLGLPSVADSLR